MEYIKPSDIEKRSFEIIGEELERRDVHPDPEIAPVLKRVIHTTADFDYVENLKFSDGAVRQMQAALRRGANIVTDTHMAEAGINHRRLERYGGQVLCYMTDPQVAETARERGVTRASVSMEHAAQLEGPVIFAIGNAPTALEKLYELTSQGSLHPAGIIGVPVGFVNVVEAKEQILSLQNIPYIVARGRKGGSNVAAAICNALLYSME